MNSTLIRANMLSCTTVAVLSTNSQFMDIFHNCLNQGDTFVMLKMPCKYDLLSLALKLKYEGKFQCFYCFIL